MSRSFKKTPIAGIASGVSDKIYKVSEHRRERSTVKQMLKSEKWDLLPHPKQYGNPYDSVKDGKLWQGYQCWKCGYCRQSSYKIFNHCTCPAHKRDIFNAYKYVYRK